MGHHPIRRPIPGGFEAPHWSMFMWRKSTDDGARPSRSTSLPSPSSYVPKCEAMQWRLGFVML